MRQLVAVMKQDHEKKKHEQLVAVTKQELN
jgi:hypothetical protein